MDELESLEYLSLVSNICTELDNHLGINDKDVAEFIIHLAQKNGTYDGFRTELAANQVEFPDSFTSNLYRIILKMLPSASKKTEAENRTESQSEQSRQLTDAALRKAMCPALSKPNDPSVRVC